MRLKTLGKDKETSSARMCTVSREPQVEFPTLQSCCRNSHAGQAPRACTGRAGPAPAPRNSPKSTKPAQSLQSCAFFNTKPNPLGFQTMWWIFAMMLKYFHPVIKSPPIHRLQHSLEIPTFEESIFPAHPTQECILSWAHTQPFGTRAVKCLRTLGEGSKYSDR